MFKLLQLNNPLRRTSSAYPDDVLNTKTALQGVGYYDPPKWGVTPYPDNDMFEGIRAFQKRKGLKVDGYINPGGETEDALSKALTNSYTNDNASKKNPTRKSDGVQVAAAAVAAAAPAVPWIASQLPSWAAGVAGMLGLSLSLSGDSPQDDNCDHQLYNVDTPTCNAIKNRRGAAAAQRCFSSANARYAACLAGKPRDQWPPLDTWNN